MSLNAAVGVWGLLICSGNLFVYCYTADRTTTALAAVDNMAYETQWFNYPVHLRSYLVLIIRRAQKPVIFHGLKLYPCNLVTFATVSTNQLYAMSYKPIICYVLCVLCIQHS